MFSIKNPIPLDLHQVLTPNRLLGLWRLMQGYRLMYLGAALSIAVSSLARTSTALLLRYYVDNVLDGKQFNTTMYLVALGFIALAAIEGSFSFTSGRLASKSSEGITKRLRDYLYDHLQRLPFSYHRTTSTGELIERVTSDVDAVRRFFSDQAINVIRITVLFTINFVALLELNTQLALVSIVVIPVVVLISAFFFKKVSKIYENYQEQEAVLSTTLQENLTGIRVVKAFARQDYEMNKFEQDNWEKYQRGIKLLRMHSVFWPISDLLCGSQILVGLMVGAFLTINGSITLGTYMAYSGLIGAIIFPMRNLGRLIVAASTGLVSYNRVYTIIKENRENLLEGEVQPEDDVKGEFKFQQVGFEYEKDNPILQDITFECKAGQIVALLGSTGSGKTSLVNLLPRFFDYCEGQILLDGVDLLRYPRRYLRQQVGIVEQEPFLFSRSIRENISYGVGRDVAQEEIERAARSAAIHDVIMSFPEGYDTLVGERGVTLSGGQKQRVAIARTLLKNPRILIMDDSTSSVDTETESQIREALVGLMKNRTTFIIAHRIQSIMDADLILVFEKGHIVQKGSHDELMAQPGIYQQICDIQTRIDVELEEEITRVSI